MKFKNSLTGEIYTTSQVITYSDITPDAATGIEFSTINNTLYNLPAHSTTYTVPFLLHEQLDNISATSEYNNQAFAPAISCPGTSPYPAGTLCTLYVKISDDTTNDIISGNIVVTGSYNPKTQRKYGNLGINQTGYLFSVPITIVQNNLGNLVTSSINTIINPANGTSPKTIILLNNGAGPITGIRISSSGIVTASNGCSATLGIGQSCSFTVNANVTTNGQATVTVNYTTGNTNAVLVFNAAYIVATTSPSITMSSNGTFINTVINSSLRTVNIKVANTSTAQLNNINFTPQSSLPAGMTYVSGGSSCATDGTESLAAGDSCILQIQYKPTSVISSTSFTLRTIAQYITSDGSTGSYNTSIAAVNYSAITANAYVYLTPNPVNYEIRANGVESQTQTFTLVNTSPVLSAVIHNLTLANPSVANYTTVGGTCGSFPRTLGIVGSGTESCTVIAKFGPVSTAVNASTQMTANYVENSTTGESAITLSALSFKASQSALIIIENITVTGQNVGNGNIISPYQFTNTPNTPIQFTIKYKNIGTQDAQSFNIALNDLPPGYYFTPTPGECPTGESSSLLPSGGSCLITFGAMSPTNPYNSYAFTGSLNINIPGYSYKDTSTGLNINKAPTFSPTYTSNTINVLAILFANPVTGTPIWSTGTAGGTNSFTFSNMTPGTIITIPNTQLTIFNFSSGRSCTVVISNFCSISITNPAGYPLNTPVNFLYIVSPSGQAPNGIIRTGSFSYSG
jgi:hypothetical protein